MKMSNFKKVSSFLLCLVLIAAVALSFTGCVDDIETEETTAPTISDNNDGTEAENADVDDNVIGEGSISFEFSVVDADGNEFHATIRTDKTTVGDALLDLGLIAGENSDYGLYVKTVNGTTLDYEKDGKYWAFYIGDEYAMTGVDSTDIVAGETYSFKAE